MAVLRKEKGDMKELEILLRQIVDQITANVIANSIYEFDGKGLVKSVSYTHLTLPTIA